MQTKPTLLMRRMLHKQGGRAKVAPLTARPQGPRSSSARRQAVALRGSVSQPAPPHSPAPPAAPTAASQPV